MDRSDLQPFSSIFVYDYPFRWRTIPRNIEQAFVCAQWQDRVHFFLSEFDHCGRRDFAGLRPLRLR
jgi:hypothetical protein